MFKLKIQKVPEILLIMGIPIIFTLSVIFTKLVCYMFFKRICFDFGKNKRWHRRGFVYHPRVFEEKVPDYGKRLIDDNTKHDSNQTALVNKSVGLLPYFDWNHFRKRFAFIDRQNINRVIVRLVENNIYLSSLQDYIPHLIINSSPKVSHYMVNFTFKTDQYLNTEQLVSFN